MTENYADEVCLVRVLTDEREQQVWMAAAGKDYAVSLVLDAVPEGWSASLIAEKLTPQEIASLKLRPGDTRRLRT
jgi:hypothetical protein